MQAMPPPPPVSLPADRASQRRFPVRLSRPWWQAGLSDNTLGLRGDAVLVCDGVTVTLQGLRSWQVAQVFNVVREGRSVAFQVLGEDRLVDRVRLWCRNVASAQAARLALPANVTAGAAQALQEHHQFEDRLDVAHPPPRWTRRLVAINLLVFALAATTGAGVLEPDPRVLLAWGTNFSPLTLHGQQWRLLTSMFLHFGLLHLAFNMWALLSGGRFAERLFGPRRFLVIYFAAGLSGSLTSALWNPQVNSAGASGAIIGVFGAILAWFLRADHQVPASVIRQQRTSGIVFILINLGYGATQSGIDNAAHLGGLVAGLLLGWLLARPDDGAVSEDRQDAADGPGIC